MLNRIATTILTIGLSLTTASAFAGQAAPIFKAPISAQEASKSKRFAINPELGRAWVEIDILHPFSETLESHRVAIPGLVYDKDGSRVIYEADGKTISCASVRQAGKWIFKSHRIEPTGNCELTRKYVKVPIDDGFAVDVIEHFEVHFTPVDRFGSAHESVERQS